MINFNRRTKVLVCKEPTDMRASYDTLFSKAKGVLNKAPLSGHLFVFINSRKTSIKCLYWNGTRMVFLCKRMNQGTFSRLNPMFRGEIILTAKGFDLFFEGASFEKGFIDSPRKKHSQRGKSCNLFWFDCGTN
ncbi:MAG: IS66 family insertion sequence element accessory protein TnpB [Bdellovibrionales bacterium]|nr:IS66 family insertion sequence element accessory protein TnpB [Bdellovibrionales bacterium]